MARPRRKARDIRLSPDELDRLYSARYSLGTSARKKLKFSERFDAYLQDPQVGLEKPGLEFDDECFVEVEPNFGDGPTSARFAVVDFNADTATLAPAVTWNEAQHRFLASDGKPLTHKQAGGLQFDQVSVWALLQRALAFFEEPAGLGRPLPWGFEGNRLIVVPHAGYGKNAYYDRVSKSLQFYYFDTGSPANNTRRRVYTCRSPDIVHHEFGHAVLDGVRPYLIESSNIETAAFHESIGDLTAVLLLLRNNQFREYLAAVTEGDLSKAEDLSNLAEQFGTEVKGRPYLRSAANDKTMDEVAESDSAHEVSQVLTGAVFDILIELSKIYVRREKKVDGRKVSVKDGFWQTIQRMQRMALQPLDFLPPVDVTFRDYALAMLRAEELANPKDPGGYRDAMIGIFVSRGILTEEDKEWLEADGYLLERGVWDFPHQVGRIASSRTAAYRFINENRYRLGIPQNCDVVVADLYTAQKFGRQNRRLPRQTILEYVWREDLQLNGKVFGPLRGKPTSMLCGGTLVFDDTGLLWHTSKPGTEFRYNARERKKPEVQAIIAEGEERRRRHLDSVARLLRLQQVGAVVGSDHGILGTQVPPFLVDTTQAGVRVFRSPHLAADFDHDHDDHGEGGFPWEISY